MSKINTITISNFKAISDLSIDFKGMTAIVTAGNNKGKTSFLKGIPDRIRFIRPDVMVKDGEKKGRGEMTLDTGEKFVWDFSTDGVDKLTYITDKGRASVTKELGAQFFPPVFDIDKFLQSSPRAQVKQLQAIVGVNFEDVDKRYQVAYDARTERNREAEIYHVKLGKMLKAPFVQSVDLSELLAKKEDEKKKLNALYLKNKSKNDVARYEYTKAKEALQKQIDNHSKCANALSTLMVNGYNGDALAFVDGLKKAIIPLDEPTYIEEMPDRTNLDEIDSEIVAASQTNAEAQKYKEYTDHVNATETAQGAADEADLIVKSIEDERKQMIESANFPEGISINSEGILVDGLPLDKNQISTSKLYCAALRIASMNLGEVKTLYFDASFLDRNTLTEIQEWANKEDLQLLIERPDFEAGEIKYELIENHG